MVERIFCFISFPIQVINGEYNQEHDCSNMACPGDILNETGCICHAYCCYTKEYRAVEQEFSIFANSQKEGIPDVRYKITETGILTVAKRCHEIHSGTKVTFIMPANVNRSD
jgi:hypothetical protein